MSELIERTLALVKPDGVERSLVGRVISRYEENGLSLVHLQMMHLTEKSASRFYSEHKDAEFFLELISFMTSGRIVALVLEGDDAVSVVRSMNGATDLTKASPGTIRGDFGLTNRRNVVHGSDSVENARREIRVLFSPSQIRSWSAAGE